MGNPENLHTGTERGSTITVSGPHGTGKSTYAKCLAEALELRYVSAGELFRNIARHRNLSLESLSSLAADDPGIDAMLDERTKVEAQKGCVVIDAQLGAWMVKDLADARVLLTASDIVRFKRIAERDRVQISDARRETEFRESNQEKRYKKFYGIDVKDESVYDLKFDTSIHTIDETKKIIIESVRSFLLARGKLKQAR